MRVTVRADVVDSGTTPAKAGRRPEPLFAYAPGVIDAEQMNWLRGMVRLDVAAGYLDPDEIVDGIAEALADEIDNLEAHTASALVRRLVAEELDRHRAEQATWPVVTDYDRLANAFAELEECGVVARENFTCCSTCAGAEMGAEIRTYGPDARGYTYFHEQDTEGAVDGDGLYLAYGAVSRSRAGSLAIGRELVEVLCRHGLATEWDGSIQKRIFVRMDWKRRRDL